MRQCSFFSFLNMIFRNFAKPKILLAMTNNPLKNRTFPYIIAGPCSAESREQMETIVHELSLNPKVTMVRCGIWKPRTRPGGFEGMGETALQWIREIKQQHPLLQFCCEVAKPSHIEACIRYGIDAVWIGARTSGNPFSMAELTESLRGTNMPIMVKNPMMPDINAWIGAIERCCQIGADQVIAIHRGFNVFNNLGYRNNPLWEIPMEFKRRMPEIPIICDPSHICGNSKIVADMAQTALDFNFDGLMIEVHNRPQQALTDGAQQITPYELNNLLDKLVVKHESNIPNAELNTLRSQIDTIDKEILNLVESRLALSKKIAEIKRTHNLTIYQPKRWEEVLNQKLQLADELGLSKDFVKELFERIHTESVRVQEIQTNPDCNQ